MTGLRKQLLHMLELDDMLDQWAIPNPEGTTMANRTSEAVDRLVREASTALAEHRDSRKVAVQHLATGPARAATVRLARTSGADLTDASELAHAHQIIAELAARIAERDKP